jgi:hypothetical protein
MVRLRPWRFRIEAEDHPIGLLDSRRRTTRRAMVLASWLLPPGEYVCARSSIAGNTTNAGIVDREPAGGDDRGSFFSEGTNEVAFPWKKVEIEKNQRREKNA